MKPKKENNQAASAGLAANFAAMMALQLGAYAMSFATFPYLARVLGPHQFGVLGYATAIAAYGTTLTEWGFNLSGPRAVVECRSNQKHLNELIWSIICGKAVLCVASFTVLCAVLSFNAHVDVDFPVVLASWMAVVANVFTMYWLMQGLERFRVLAVVVLFARLVMLPLTFIFVRGPGDVLAAAAIQAGGPLLSALVSLVVAHRAGVLDRPVLSVRTIFRRLVQGADMFVATASVSLFSTANTLILGARAGVSDVGMYAAADKIRTVGNVIPAQINQVFFPRISALFKKQRHQAAKLTALGLCVVLSASLAVVATLTSFSSEISSLILGHGYAGSAPVLQLLGVCAMLGNLSYFIGLQILVPFGGARTRSLIMLLGGLFNTCLSLMLVPRLGANGAAVSLLIAEGAVLLSYLVVVASNAQLREYSLSGFSRTSVTLRRG